MQLLTWDMLVSFSIKPAYVGDTLTASSKVIGLKENSNGKTGTVYVKSIGKNQDGEIVLTYFQMVNDEKKKGRND